MVFESYVVDLLNKFAGQYLENLDSSQLRLGIWGGGSTSLLHARTEPFSLSPNVFESYCFYFLTINVDVCRRCQTGKFDSKGERFGKITVISFYVICVFIGECGFVLIGTLQRSV